MNSKKFNIYKSAVCFDIATALILIAGLVVGLIWGLNSSASISSLTVLNVILALFVVMLVMFVYVAIKYEPYLAFTMVLSVAVNVMLTISLVCVIRIPLEDSFVVVIALVAMLSIINNIILFANKPDYKKTANREQMVNGLVSKKLKPIVLLNCVLISVAILLIFTFDLSIVMLIRPLLVGLVSVLYTTVFMCAPFWGYFVKEKKVKKQENVEQDYVK